MKNNFVMIGNFILDLVVSEEHSFENDVTDFPVESGGSFTDNIRPKPMKLTLEGLVTNTPITRNLLNRAREPGMTADQSKVIDGNLNTLNTMFSSPNATAFRNRAIAVEHLRSEQAYEYLKLVMASRDVVTVRTSLGVFENMAMESLSIPRDAGTGDVLKFNATFKQVQKVTNERLKSSTGKKRNGQRPTTPSGAPGTMRWNRRVVPGALPPSEFCGIWLILRVEQRLTPEGPQLWFPKVQPILTPYNFQNYQPDPANPIEAAIVQSKVKTKQQIVGDNAGDPRESYKDRKLTADETSAFYQDQAADRKLAQLRAEQSVQPINNAAADQQIRNLGFEPTRDSARKPLADPSVVARKRTLVAQRPVASPAGPIVTPIGPIVTPIE